MTTTLNMVKTGNYANQRIFGRRHVQCILCFFCLSLAYAWRVNLSVAIVAMAKSNDSETDSDSIFSVKKYEVNSVQQGYLFASFFWGYVITQVPGGYIAQRYGAKMLLSVGITICAVLTILTPMSVKFGGWIGMCVIRGLQGLAQGAVHPATHVLLSKWSPVSERGMLATICYSGAQFGTIAMLATSGFIADTAMGWPGIFYVGGACGFVWVIFWRIFASSTPEKDRRISPGELKFIQESRSVGKMQEADHLAPTPWKHIFTSMPFLSLLVVHCTHMWGFWTLLMQIPNYIKSIYNIDIKSSALLSSLPYTVMLLLSFFFVFLSKVLANQKSLSTAFNRKLFNTIGHWLPMCGLIVLGYVPDATWGIVVLTFTVGISAATYLGFQVNHIDLSPNYAGTLMGITNGAANVMSGLAQIVVGSIVLNSNDIMQWRYVFFLAAGFYFIGNLLFLIFGRTEIQWWDSPLEDAETAEQGVPLSPAQMSKV
ncbi:putative inorganic phosphate cotransporter [Drosophila busckii]|uniref:putative inorganic phosphate cotransporter n=1 Tax=Drosophila busckii TaxID=30019 RepID=UPI00083ED4F4|nr:putative inorganic phosphate cotransporter [Drosophila busckii]